VVEDGEVWFGLPKVGDIWLYILYRVRCGENIKGKEKAYDVYELVLLRLLYVG
jgi:hypothetical protein